MIRTRILYPWQVSKTVILLQLTNQYSTQFVPPCVHILDPSLTRPRKVVKNVISVNETVKRYLHAFNVFAVLHHLYNSLLGTLRYINFPPCFPLCFVVKQLGAFMLLHTRVCAYQNKLIARKKLQMFRAVF